MAFRPCSDGPLANRFVTVRFVSLYFRLAEKMRAEMFERCRCYSKVYMLIVISVLHLQSDLVPVWDFVCNFYRAVLRDFCCLGSFCIQSLQSNQSSVIWDLHSYLILSIVRERVNEAGRRNIWRKSYLLPLLWCTTNYEPFHLLKVYLPTRILVELWNSERD